LLRLEFTTATERSEVAYSLQCKKMRDIALNIHKSHELYIKVHLQASLLKCAKTLALYPEK